MTRRLDILAAVVVVAAAGVVGCTSSTPSPAGPSADTAPPATVIELESTVVDGASVALSWQPSAAPDLAGYHVYRSVESTGGTRPRDARIEAEELLTSVTQPHFEDTTVVPGAVYTYAVSAYDVSGNESPRTWTGEITVESTYSRPARTPGDVAP
jgi:fibronectin type 3 domain-containing protein